MPFRLFSGGAKPAQEVERRAKVRFLCNQQAFCQPVTEDLWWQATVRNLSYSGMALVITRRLEPGMTLAIELEGLARPVRACVIHVERQAEGGWLVGCELDQELTAE